MLPWYGLKLAFMSSNPASPFKNKNGKLGKEKKVSWTENIPVADLKAVGLKCRATINDIIMACCSIALRRYALAKGVESPRNVRIVVPVSVRDLHVNKVVLDNRVSCVFVWLPLSEPDPLTALRKVKRQMDYLKRAPDALVMYFLINIMVSIFPSSWCRAIETSFYDKCTLTITNVPGRRTKANFAGALVRGLVPWVPLVGRGQLGLAAFTYGGNLIISCLADSLVIEDPELITREFVCAFEELKEKVGA